MMKSDGVTVFRREFNRINEVLSSLLVQSSSNSVFLVDKTGQLVTCVGDTYKVDMQAFATLSAADFAANDQLALLLGEKGFNSLFHQGEKTSVYCAAVDERVILVVVFDDRTTLGLVRLKVNRLLEELRVVFNEIFHKLHVEEEIETSLDSDFAFDAESEIDSLFTD